MVNDPISDFIINIKNAGLAHKGSVLLPHSKLKEAIAKVLVAEGYIKSATRIKNNSVLEVVLNYENGKPKIKKVLRVSKLSRRVYKGFDEIHLPKGGFGRTIFSTSKGILTDRQALKEKIGGEELFKIF